jgi:L-alanine-DL-glutamate epimerase-like enolase superfamily enzyme
MKIDRRTFTGALTAATGALIGSGRTMAQETAARETVARETAAPASRQAGAAKAAAGLTPTRITKIRLFYPPNYDPNGAQGFPQSNMIVLVDTDAGITGVGQGGSPDTVRNVARSVIGKNAFDTEAIWQAAYMDAFYSPGKERLHALGAIDVALWDIKGKALNAPLYQLFGGKAREHIELYATMGVPPGLIPPAELQKMSLKDRAAAAMAAGYRVFRVDGAVLPRPAGGAAQAAAVGRIGSDDGRGQPGGVFNARSRIRLIAEAAAQIRDGIGPDGDWMIDLHQKFDFHEAVEVCNLIAPMRPFCVEDPLREEQFRTQIPKLRLLTTVPLAPGEEWGTRAEFSPLVEARDIDFARASLPNVGGITEMLKIMAICDTHKVGIVPHFTGPVATAGLRVPRVPQRQGLAQRSAGTRRDRRHGAAEADRGNYHRGSRRDLPSPRRVVDALVVDRTRIRSGRDRWDGRVCSCC